MKVSSLDAIIRAFSCASKDPSRYQIQMIRLKRVSKTHFSIASTDGAAGMIKTVEDKDFSSLLNEETFLVLPDSLPFLKSVLKDNRKLESLETSLNDHSISIDSKLSQISVVLAKSEKGVGYSFPDLESILPKIEEKESLFEISFQPHLLLNLLNAMRQDHNQIAVKLRVKNKTSVIQVIVGDQEKGVLAPYRQ